MFWFAKIDSYNSGPLGYCSFGNKSRFMWVVCFGFRADRLCNLFNSVYLKKKKFNCWQASISTEATFSELSTHSLCEPIWIIFHCFQIHSMTTFLKTDKSTFNLKWSQTVHFCWNYIEIWNLSRIFTMKLNNNYSKHSNCSLSWNPSQCLVFFSLCDLFINNWYGWL